MEWTMKAVISKFTAICHRFDYIHKLIDWTSIKFQLGQNTVPWLADIQMSLCYDDDDADVVFSGWKLWSNYIVGAVGLVCQPHK